MDTELKQRITEKLREFLNREPSEDEIINAQNDTIIMGKIQADKLDELLK